MVSAPSVRKKRRQAVRAEKREAMLARGGLLRSPLLWGIGAVLLLLIIVVGTAALRRWTADPWERGQQAMANADYRNARVDLMNAVEAAPRALDRRVLLSDALAALGRGREAENQLRRTLELGASPVRLRPLLAHSLALQGRDEEALQELAAGPVAPQSAALAARVAGEANYRLGNFGAAATAFGESIRLAPNDAPTWVAFAAWRLAEQDMPGADQAADRARQLAPNSVRALSAKALVVRARGGPVSALPWFELALAADPNDVATLAEHAATLGEAGRYRDMMGPLGRAAALAPDNARVLFLEATVAARGGEPALARGLLTRIRGRDADLPAVLLLRAAVEQMLGAPTAAAQFAGRLVEQQPDNRAARRLLAAALVGADNPRGAIETLDPITTQGDADSWSLLLLGRAFGAIGWQTDSVHPLERAASLRRGDARPLLAASNAGDIADPRVAVPYIRARMAAGAHSEALALAQRLAADNLGVPPAFLLLGDAAWAAQNRALAVSAYRRAAELRFDEPAMLRLVGTLLKINEREEAGRVLGAFLARYPENVAAMRVAANYAAENGDWAGGRSWLAAALARIGPNDALLLSQLARADLELQEPARALPYARRAYRLLPSNATVSGVYGIALLRSGGARGDARLLLEKAVSLAPGDAVLRSWQAEAQR